MKREFNIVVRFIMVLISVAMVSVFAGCSTSSTSTPGTGIVTGTVREVSAGGPIAGAIITIGTVTTVADGNGHSR